MKQVYPRLKRSRPFPFPLEDCSFPRSGLSDLRKEKSSLGKRSWALSSSISRYTYFRPYRTFNPYWKLFNRFYYYDDITEWCGNIKFGCLPTLQKRLVLKWYLWCAPLSVCVLQKHTNVCFDRVYFGMKTICIISKPSFVSHTLQTSKTIFSGVTYLLCFM